MDKNVINQGDVATNNISRRSLMKGGVQSMVAGIVGLVSIWGEAQDQTVAAVTPWNSFPWRNLETTKKSGFAKQ